MKTPLFLLTGFLGAGKTTWLKNVLSIDQYGNTAVLVNEFGDVGIDHMLVDSISSDIVLLDSGCICCQIRAELKDAILDLLNKRAQGTIPAFENIVVETTGLADPAQIFSTLFMDPILKNQISLAGVVTVVDVMNAVELHSRQAEWAAQVGAATVILLSKTDLAQQTEIQAVEKLLSSMCPGIQLYQADQITDLISLPPNYEMPGLEMEGTHTHLKGVSSLCLKTERDICWETFIIWLSALIHNHGDRLLRVKCLINTENNGVLALDGVGHTLYQPAHIFVADNKMPEKSLLVFIARDLDLKLVEMSFKRYVSEYGIS